MLNPAVFAVTEVKLCAPRSNKTRTPCCMSHVNFLTSFTITELFTIEIWYITLIICAELKVFDTVKLESLSLFRWDQHPDD